ncbi:protein neprosin-like [Aristolochia californica]|uniref:protein neprosin-like n=1 Tax=Aristolochia californica TaxID=171875 RepID=UPI0035DA84A3
MDAGLVTEINGRLRIVFLLGWVVYIAFGDGESARIQTEYGDVFSCVDITKQPAFNHPLLKNNIIQMRPNYIPKAKKTKASKHAAPEVPLPGAGCPFGTVPILIKKATQVRRTKSPPRSGRRAIGEEDEQDFHWAVLSTGQGEFYGTQANINTWAPKLTDENQFTTSQMWILSGPEKQLNAVEAGWMVDPHRFGDHLARLFIFWTRDAYNKTGCWNLDCPGFVQVNPKIPIGIAILPTSVYGGRQHEITLLVFQDPRRGDWWLAMGNDNKLVGYWPKSLFTHLAKSASMVIWGGEVYKPKKAASPPMGSGHFAEEGYGKSCYMRQMGVVVKKNVIVDAPPDTSNATDVPRCFNVIDHGKGDDDDNGRFFFFGGPGGFC